MFLPACQFMRGKGGWEQAVGEKKKNSERAERAFTEFRFCVPTADTAEPTHKLMREGGEIPISTTKRLGYAPLITIK